ncbi:hypothetical protein [Rhodospirillaceae bacterium SYSU D60014]|uniref:hypothetical protein n=1 Tax=Virgifigura deserti TaxID=2268457 RepID=UPI000E664C46
MSKAEQRNGDLRRAAEALWSKNKKRNEEVLTAKENERRTDALKTARLREQRLEKEAADKKAAVKGIGTSRRKPATP